MPALVLSEPLVVDLKVYRGDTGGFRITVTDSEVPPGPVDVSTATWDADIRLKATDATVITSFDVVPVTGDVSSVDVKLPSDKSYMLDGNCVYDVQMTLDGNVYTLVGGKITVTQDVSRT
jgi:hypothetical protein